MKEENVLNATPETEEAKVSVYYSIIIPAYNAENILNNVFRASCLRAAVTMNFW